MVRLVVGPDAKPVSFHKNLIRQYSEYFFRAFGPNFREGDDGDLALPETSETACRIFQTWIYMQVTRTLHLATVTFVERSTPVWHRPSVGATWAGPQLNIMDENIVDDLIHRLIDLYIFADAYESVKLRNDIMTVFTALLLRNEHYPGFDSAAVMFRRLPSSSTLCQWTIKCTALFWDGYAHSSEDLEALPRDFISQLMVLIAQRRTDQTEHSVLEEELEQPCNFHEHINEEEKEDCMLKRFEQQPYIDALISACFTAHDGHTLISRHDALDTAAIVVENE